mmetsp:Transcript_2173/g.4494  ORF Transcript_2173/g.4494 Transcript_2173/m.4494 type:complete len:232 (-) Transcript_2173:1323-2018(-)
MQGQAARAPPAAPRWHARGRLRRLPPVALRRVPRQPPRAQGPPVPRPRQAPRARRRVRRPQLPQPTRSLRRGQEEHGGQLRPSGAAQHRRLRAPPRAGAGGAGGQGAGGDGQQAAVGAGRLQAGPGDGRGQHPRAAAAPGGGERAAQQGGQVGARRGQRGREAELGRPHGGAAAREPRREGVHWRQASGRDRLAAGAGRVGAGGEEPGAPGGERGELRPLLRGAAVRGALH